MLFGKNVLKRISETVSKVSINEDEFLEIPGLNRKIAQEKLRSEDGKLVYLDFAEAQLLTRELSKSYGMKIRLPTTREDYIASKLNKRCEDGYSPEWKAEYLDGSFLMTDPEVRIVSSPRRYEFDSDFTRIFRTLDCSAFKDNGSSCWIGVTKDEYDRAAFTNGFYEKKHIVGAIPPLSKDCLGIRLLIEEK